MATASSASAVVMQHAALTLSIAIGALINALWLLLGLLKRGSYKPLPGWGKFALQVCGASALLAAFLLWATGAVNWVGLKGHNLERIGWLALVLLASAVLYFAALWVSGLKVTKLLKH